MASERGRGVLTRAGVPRKSNTGTRKPVVDDANWRAKARGKHRIKFDDVAKAKYLQALRETGRKWFAEQAADVARSTVDAHLKNDPEFAEAYEDAVAEYSAPKVLQIEKELCEGHERKTYGPEGQLLKDERVYETRLREKFLEAYEPEKYRQKSELDVSAKGGVILIPCGASADDWARAVAEHDRKNREHQDPDAGANVKH